MNKEERLAYMKVRFHQLEDSDAIFIPVTKHDVAEEVKELIPFNNHQKEQQCNKEKSEKRLQNRNSR